MVNKPPSKRLQLLKDRNEKLSAQTQVQREEIHRLQRRLEQLEDKEQQWQDHVLCINRLWEELNNSISFLNFRASGTLDEQENIESSDINLLNEANPFLAKLVTTFLGNSHASVKHVIQDISEVEATLRERMKQTMQGASRVLDAIETSRPSVDNDKESSSQLAAVNSLLRADNNKLRDQSLQDATKIRELQSSLADKQEELLVAQRKLVQIMQQQGSGGVNNAPQSAAPQETQTNNNNNNNNNNNTTATATATAMDVDDAGKANEEIQRLQTLLKRRDEEVDARDAALNKADSEIKDLRAQLQYEKDSAHRARQHDQDRVKQLSSDLDALDQRLRDSHRERDNLVSRLQEAQYAADAGVAATRRLASTNARIDQLEDQLQHVRAARVKAETEVERLKAATANAKTTEEYVQLVSSLEKDLEASQTAANKYKAAAEGAEEAHAVAAKAQRALEESTTRLKIVRERLDDARGQLVRYGIERKQLKEREEELRLFVEATLAHSDDGDGIQAQVEQFLSEQKETVLQRLQEAANNNTMGDNNNNGNDELKRQVELLEEDNAALQTKTASLEKQVNDLLKQAESLKGDSEIFMKEMENVAEAYATAREQNSRLLEKIAARDQDSVRLLSEAADATRERSAMMEERDAALANIRDMHEMVKTADARVAELERKVNSLTEDVAAAKAEARQLGARNDALGRELKSAQASLAAAKDDADAVRKEREKIAEERNQEAELVRKERTRAERAEQDAKALQSSIKQQPGLGSGGGGLADECAALRKMVNCNVCSARLKDRIITKCNHIFCNHCIEANLATRHRKCPGCGERFGLNDVKPFYFT